LPAFVYANTARPTAQPIFLFDKKSQIVILTLSRWCRFNIVFGGSTR